MFSHITVGCDDLGAAGQFYDALLNPLGFVRRAVKPDGGPPSLCWTHPRKAVPRFYVYRPFDGRPASAGNGGMIAFLARTPAEVDQAFVAALVAGGRDDGGPAERPHYGQGYYGAYVRDPGGNKVHIVHRGDLKTEGEQQ